MRGSRCLFGIKKLQFMQHRFRQKPKWGPDYKVKAGGFYEKRKPNRKRRKNSCHC